MSYTLGTVAVVGQAGQAGEVVVVGQAPIVQPSAPDSDQPSGGYGPPIGASRLPDEPGMSRPGFGDDSTAPTDPLVSDSKMGIYLMIAGAALLILLLAKKG